MSPSCRCWIADVEQPHSGVSAYWPFHPTQHPTLGLLSHLNHWWSPYHHTGDITLNLCGLLVPEKKNYFNISTNIPAKVRTVTLVLMLKYSKEKCCHVGWQHSLARGIGMIGRREEQQCMGTRSMACINVLRGNAKTNGKLLHAQCDRNIFLHLNTCITAMKFYNGNPSYTLKTEYDTKFYNSRHINSNL